MYGSILKNFGIFELCAEECIYKVARTGGGKSSIFIDSNYYSKGFHFEIFHS